MVTSTLGAAGGGLFGGEPRKPRPPARRPKKLRRKPRNRPGKSR